MKILTMLQIDGKEWEHEVRILMSQIFSKAEKTFYRANKQREHWRTFLFLLRSPG
jgi:hypothetical protein